MQAKPTCAWHPQSSRVRISLVDLAALIRSSLLFIALALACVACGTATPAGATPIEPAKLERIEGSDLQRVRLSQRASERLGIETAPVREAQVTRRGAPTAAATSRIVVPYSAVVYDLRGETWAYVTTEPLVFQRHALRVDYIEGDLAVLLEGPPVGTVVVTVGVAELFGIELGVGK
jgi:hypothetical protein